MKKLLISLSTLLFLNINPVVAQMQTKEKATFVKKSKLNYLLWLPADYQSNKKEKFPLIIFLHGSGERGNDLELVKRNGPPSFVENRHDFPFIMVSPQCPENTWWIIEDLQGMLMKIETKYRIDTDRIYLTGLSMGGFGTWEWATKFPDQFAAIAPVCGGGDVIFADKLTKIPIWAFHGDADPVVPVNRTTDMVKAINEKGGSALMTIYPGVGHGSWVEAYNDEELYKWFLRFTKKK